MHFRYGFLTFQCLVSFNQQLITMLSNMMLTLLVVSLVVAVLAAPLSIEEREQSACKKTKVAVLGAGAAGVFAAVSQYALLAVHGSLTLNSKHCTMDQSTTS